MFKNLTIAEKLSFFRIITFPVMVALIFLVEKHVYGWIYIILFSTDAFDGFFAWLQKNDSDRREFFDSWGDNLYILAGLIGFYHFEPLFFKSYFVVTLVVLGLYMFELILSLIKFGKPSYFHNYLAKTAAFFQIVFLAYLFFFEANLLLFLLAAFLSVLDVIDEVIILYNIKKWRTHIQGFWQVV